MDNEVRSPSVDDPRRLPGWVLGALVLLSFAAQAAAQARLGSEALARTLPFFALLGFVGAGVVVLAVPATRGTAWRGSVLGAALFGVSAAARGLHGPSWPALLVVALGLSCVLVVRGTAGTSRNLAVAAFLTEVLPLLGPRQDLPSVLGLACACAAVPLVVDALTRRWRADLEEDARAAVDRRLRELDQDARDYRLIGATTRSDLAMDVAEERRTRGSVTSVRETLYGLVELAARVMDPHTCALLWLDANGRTVRVAELVTHGDFVVLDALPADKGVVGTVLKKRAPLALCNIAPDFAGVTWYHPPQPVRALLAVPVMEGEHPRGVLVCDWLTDRAPGERDTVVLSQVAREIVRAVENERAFGGVDRERQLEGILFRVSQDFVGAPTVPDTLRITLSAARQVSGATAALMIAREERGLRVVAVDGIPADAAGREVGEQGAVKACLAATQQGGVDVSGEDRVKDLLGLAGFQVARLFAFHEGRVVVGALVLLGARQGAFALVPDDRVQTVTALGALAIANRRMFEKMERMATTDGLTGLLNHRTFQERLAESLRKAIRYNHPLSVILTDIDHFKNVNDTYGHPVGDEVIRQVSAILKAQARETDVVSRYGGEEFAVVMEETAAEGALLVAERIRQAVQKLVVTTDMGPLKVTLSLGVAAYPTHGTEKHHLVERADQALYTAKHSGRNRAVIGSPLTPSADSAARPEKA